MLEDRIVLRHLSAVLHPADEIEKGAEHLKEVKRLIAAHNETEEQSPLRLPDLLMVITGGAFAYTRPDGVIVCPLSALRP